MNKLSSHVNMVMALARRQSEFFSHNLINTEHLLLALLELPFATGTKILQRCNVDLEALRSQLVERCEAVKDTGLATVDSFYTPRVKRVFMLAMHEAHLMRQSFIGTDHLLLGLMMHIGTASEHILSTQFRVTPEAIRREISRTRHAEVNQATDAWMQDWLDLEIKAGFTETDRVSPYSAHAALALILAHNQAERYSHEHFGVQHLLLGLLSYPGTSASLALQKMNVDLAGILAELDRVLLFELRPRGQFLQHSVDLKLVMRLALNESHQGGFSRISTGHFLLGILGHDNSSSSRLLSKFGVELTALRTLLTSDESVYGREGGRSVVQPEKPEIDREARTDRLPLYTATETSPEKLEEKPTGTQPEESAEANGEIQNPVQPETPAAEVPKAAPEWKVPLIVQRLRSKEQKRRETATPADAAAKISKQSDVDSIFSGKPAEVLGSHGLTEDDFTELTRVAQLASSSDGYQAGGRRVTVPSALISDELLGLLYHARREPGRFNQITIDVEHFLLELMTWKASQIQFLNKQRIPLTYLRERLESVLQARSETDNANPETYSSRLNRFLTEAIRLSKEFKNRRVEIGHVLYALLESDDPARALLIELGLIPEIAFRDILWRVELDDVCRKIVPFDRPVLNPHFYQALEIASQMPEPAPITPCHLLRGVLLVKDGLAVQVLEKMNVDAGALKVKIEERLSSVTSVTSRSPFSAESKEAIMRAMHESRLLRHSCMDDVHLLLGILHLTEGPTAELLQEFGVNRLRVIDQIMELDDPPAFPFSPPAELVFKLARRSAELYAHEWILPEHLLHSILESKCGVCSAILKGELVNIGFLTQELKNQFRSLSPSVCIEPKLSPELEKVKDHAQREAGILRSDFIGTEHLLLGLMRHLSPPAMELLLKCPFTSVDRIDQKLRSILAADKVKARK